MSKWEDPETIAIVGFYAMLALGFAAGVIALVKWAQGYT